jgi:hypothetical protein
MMLLHPLHRILARLFLRQQGRIENAFLGFHVGHQLYPELLKQLFTLLRRTLLGLFKLF